MKIIHKFLIISLFLSYSLEQECNENNCKNGECIDNIICECFNNYSTHPHTNNKKCNYRKKKQWIAFLLEAIPSFGVGHLYLKNYTLGIAKLIIWLITSILIIFMRYYTIQREWKDEIALKFGLLSCIFTTSAIIWYITDLVLIGLNKYTDGNYIDLQPW